ncbi:hypothetical protein SAMN05216389_108104 [Oceanobacillus limi]|uniref:Uncharacterized protein n=1 Tax=Oceanobacillus limi TaxID=930131 RepID=A0A1I0DBC7_9BACI|nr:DUF5325 family protein [Oceanobacillus limi]SET29426.1 hypothetical protein SAMN05216389_108104 [Oceanobacillus limi]
MKNFNFPMFLLSSLVILMFLLVGVAIAFRSIGFIILFLAIGFIIMGIGISIKRKKVTS